MKQTEQLIPSSKNHAITQPDAIQLIERSLTSVREDVRASSYIEEALRVVQVGGYRSAIGSFWNAVIDDLRNKVIARSLALFNKSVKLKREVKTYEASVAQGSLFKPCGFSSFSRSLSPPGGSGRRPREHKCVRNHTRRRSLLP